jgi:hypothetical protein
MKKKILKLRSETLRHLAPEKLRHVAGGEVTLICSDVCTQQCPTVNPVLCTHTRRCPM